MHVDVNGARLWVEEAGEGPAVLFVHGGLGDSRLWEPQANALADAFRTIRYDLRYFGRSESPGVAVNMLDDLVGVLDALGVERAALVGLSLGGGLALDATIAYPDRVWALAHVAGGASGFPLQLDPEIDAAYEAAVERGDLDAAMEIDFGIWAPLGVDDTIRELWRATPDARGVPDGADFQPRPPVHERLGGISVPTLVLIAKHDPEQLRAVGARVAQDIPRATIVKLDSDHYLTLREPERVTAILREFLAANAPPASTAASSSY
jgi:pimeloyl-ACP methyl ester carboxylesterase